MELYRCLRGTFRRPSPKGPAFIYVGFIQWAVFHSSHCKHARTVGYLGRVRSTSCKLYSHKNKSLHCLKSLNLSYTRQSTWYMTLHTKANPRFLCLLWRTIKSNWSITADGFMSSLVFVLTVPINSVFHCRIYMVYADSHSRFVLPLLLVLFLFWPILKHPVSTQVNIWIFHMVPHDMRWLCSQTKSLALGQLAGCAGAQLPLLLH